MEENNIIEWNPNSMLEVTLNEPDDFLKVRDHVIYFINKEDTSLYTSKNYSYLTERNLT